MSEMTRICANKGIKANPIVCQYSLCALKRGSFCNASTLFTTPKKPKLITMIKKEANILEIQMVDLFTPAAIYDAKNPRSISLEKTDAMIKEEYK